MSKNDELSQILSLYAKSEWDRVTRALAVLGARQLASTRDLRNLTVRQIERLAYGERVPLSGNPQELPSPRSDYYPEDKKSDDSDVAALARQMDEIRTKLASLDDKITEQRYESEPKRRRKERAAAAAAAAATAQQVTRETPSPPRKERQGKLDKHIYPSWWAHNNSLSQSAMCDYGRQKWADEEWKKQHELDCTELARQNVKINKIASTRRPIKMVFEKKEFKRPYLYRDPHPIIVTKSAALRPSADLSAPAPPPVQMPPEEPIREQQEYGSHMGRSRDSQGGHEESVHKLVDSCAGSPIINYFSGGGDYQPGADNESPRDNNPVGSVDYPQPLQEYNTTEARRGMSDTGLLRARSGNYPQESQQQQQQLYERAGAYSRDEQPARYEPGLEAGASLNSKSLESKAYYSSDAPHEGSREDELALHAGSRRTTGAL